MPSKKPQASTSSKAAEAKQELPEEKKKIADELFNANKYNTTSFNEQLYLPSNGDDEKSSTPPPQPLRRHFTYDSTDENNNILDHFYGIKIDDMKKILIESYFYDKNIKNVHLYKIQESDGQKYIKFIYDTSELKLFFHISLNIHNNDERGKFRHKCHVSIDQIIIGDYKIIFSDYTSSKKILVILNKTNNDIHTIDDSDYINNKIFEIFRFGIINREGYLILKKYLPNSLDIISDQKVTDIYNIIYNVSESFLNRVLIIYYKYKLHPITNKKLKKHYDDIKEQSSYNDKYKKLFGEEIHTFVHDNYKDLYETDDDDIFEYIIEKKKKWNETNLDKLNKRKRFINTELLKNIDDETRKNLRNELIYINIIKFNYERNIVILDKFEDIYNKIKGIKDNKKFPVSSLNDKQKTHVEDKLNDIFKSKKANIQVDENDQFKSLFYDINKENNYNLSPERKYEYFHLDSIWGGTLSCYDIKKIINRIISSNNYNTDEINELKYNMDVIKKGILLYIDYLLDKKPKLPSIQDIGIQYNDFMGKINRDKIPVRANHLNINFTKHFKKIDNIETKIDNYAKHIVQIKKRTQPKMTQNAETNLIQETKNLFNPLRNLHEKYKIRDKLDYIKDKFNCEKSEEACKEKHKDIKDLLEKGDLLEKEYKAEDIMNRLTGKDMDEKQAPLTQAPISKDKSEDMLDILYFYKHYCKSAILQDLKKGLKEIEEEIDKKFKKVKNFREKYLKYKKKYLLLKKKLNL